MAVLEDAVPPAGLSWDQVVSRWVRDCGGWTHLADQLIARAGGASGIALDPQTVERGLRRLARREHRPGGQYGRWILRYFGLPSPVEGWVRWLGQYHTRFSDLPVSLRLEQLALWNRPPVAESRLACWLHVGLASAHRSRLDATGCEEWLARAERHVAAAGPCAAIEVGLLRGAVETDAGDRAAAWRRYDAIEALLDSAALPPADDRPYRARLQDQRAHHYTRPLSGAPDIPRARALYQAIAEDPSSPFVCFRRAVGLAYCAWKMGELDEAARLAALAAQHAGDGGLVRMRVMALNMLSRVLPDGPAQAAHERARRMARLLEDEELLRRVDLCVAR